MRDNQPDQETKTDVESFKTTSASVTVLTPRGGKPRPSRCRTFGREGYTHSAQTQSVRWMKICTPEVERFVFLLLGIRVHVSSDVPVRGLL
jgi:hypothetical protein